MSRHLLASLLVLIVLSAPAAAESWVFQPSYYSHDPVTQVRIGRQYSTGPVFNRPTGGFYRSGWRYNRSTINVGGMAWDNLNLWEGWYETGAKF